MFKLLKSEFQYHKLSSIIVFGLIIVVNILLTVSNSWVKILPVGKSNISIWGLFTIYYMIFTASRLQLARRDGSEHKKSFHNDLRELTFYFIIIFLDYVFVSKINFDFSNWSVLIKQIIHSYFLTEKGIEINLIIGIVLIISTIFTFNKRNLLFKIKT